MGIPCKVIGNQPVGFMPVWRNGVIPHCGGLCFGAFRGCYSEEDFLDFAAKEQVLFENDLPDMYSPL